MGRIVEGFWDCPYCDTKGIRGGISECPTCGKVRDSSTKFYLKNNNMRYLSDEEKQTISSGPDWFCPFCESYNRSDVNVCSECGHKREEEDSDYFEIQNRRVESNPEFEPDSEPQNYYTPNYNNSIKKSKNIFKYFGIGAILLSIILLFSFFFTSTETTFEVTDIHWEYGVAVEEYRTIDESGWSLPANARLHHTQQEI